MNEVRCTCAIKWNIFEHSDAEDQQCPCTVLEKHWLTRLFCFSFLIIVLFLFLIAAIFALNQNRESRYIFFS